jgi:hypothetical protein
VDAPLSDAVVAEALPVEAARVAIGTELAEPETTAREETAPEKAEPKKAEPEPVAKKPLFWSAAQQGQSGASRGAAAAESIPVPAELRNLQKCKACGFPVSQERTFCVECEEKRWRGQQLP